MRSESASTVGRSSRVIGRTKNIDPANGVTPDPLLQMHESEASFQAVVDPYARADFFISFGEEGVELEEGFLTLTTLPGVDLSKDSPWEERPILRGLAARAPYFHNGSAATLTDVVQFYNSRFNIGFTEAEIADLVAFLRAQ